MTVGTLLLVVFVFNVLVYVSYNLIKFKKAYDMKYSDIFVFPFCLVVFELGVIGVIFLISKIVCIRIF